VIYIDAEKGPIATDGISTESEASIINIRLTWYDSITKLRCQDWPALGAAAETFILRGDSFNREEIIIYSTLQDGTANRQSSPSGSNI
jgi:hypothetical protein